MTQVVLVAHTLGQHHLAAFPHPPILQRDEFTLQSE